MNMKNYTMIALFAMTMFGTIIATTTSPLQGTLSNIMQQIQSLVPVVALLMFVMAGLIYGIGQVMGAEVRGRAAVWAQALLIGGIIGLMIAALAPIFVGIFSSNAIITTT